MLLNGTQSQENFEKFKSLIGKVSENDVKEFSKLQVADELSKMQERGDISSYSEEDVEYLSQKQFECYQELYKVTGKRSPLQLTSEEVDIVLRDENVQQVLYEIKSYSESLHS
jgi:hypothetical protein